MKMIFLVSGIVTCASVACKPNDTVAQTNSANSSSASSNSFANKVCQLISANLKTFQKATPSAEGAKQAFCGGIEKSPEKATLVKVLGATYADACQAPGVKWFSPDNAKTVSQTANKLFDASMEGVTFNQKQNDQLHHFGSTLSNWAETLVRLQWGTPLNNDETQISNLKDMACKSELPTGKKVFENLVCVPLYNASMFILDQKTTDEFRNLGDLCVNMASGMQ